MSRCQAATPEGAPGLQSRKSVNGMHLGSICPAVSGRIGSAHGHGHGNEAIEAVGAVVADANALDEIRIREASRGGRGGAGAVPEVCTNVEKRHPRLAVIEVQRSSVTVTAGRTMVVFGLPTTELDVATP